MLGLIFIIMAGVTLLEVYLLAVVAKAVGFGGVLLLIIVTAALGSTAARWQGRRAWLAVADAMRAGRLPADEILDGLLILAGGLMMMTPGVFTDAIGFSLILPILRPAIRPLIQQWLKRRISITHLSPGSQPGAPGPESQSGPVSVVDTTARKVDTPEDASCEEDTPEADKSE